MERKQRNVYKHKKGGNKMKEQKKQIVLTIVIVVLVMILIAIIASIVYEEMINRNNQNLQETILPEVNEENLKEDVIPEEEENKKDEEIENDITENDEYVGEEEQKIEEKPAQNGNSKSDDEKAIDLAKKEWGIDDSVIFSIDKKKNTKYYISVRKDAAVLQWYEVDIETWEISEY